MRGGLKTDNLRPHRLQISSKLIATYLMSWRVSSKHMKQIVRSVIKWVFFQAKRLFFPGFDLHTRCRYRKLPRMFQKGPIRTLDAGCGNGCLTFAAYQLGNKVVGVELNADQVTRNREFFGRMGYKDIEFEVYNLYDLRNMGRKYDQIICSETLEHIARDTEIIKIFAEILTDNGILHLCCPYALHPDYYGWTYGPENGGHVRAGYTLESYKALLEPAGFTIVSHLGLGSKLLCRADRAIGAIRTRLGDVGALPLYLLFGWVAVFLDDHQSEPEIPLSLYIQAIKNG